MTKRRVLAGLAIVVVALAVWSVIDPRGAGGALGTAAAFVAAVVVNLVIVAFSLLVMIGTWLLWRRWRKKRRSRGGGSPTSSPQVYRLPTT